MGYCPGFKPEDTRLEQAKPDEMVSEPAFPFCFAKETDVEGVYACMTGYSLKFCEDACDEFADCMFVALGPAPRRECHFFSANDCPASSEQLTDSQFRIFTRPPLNSDTDTFFPCQPEEGVKHYAMVKPALCTILTGPNLQRCHNKNKCIVYVRGMMGVSCSEYCSGFGMTCKRAWEESDNSCNAILSQNTILLDGTEVNIGRCAGKTAKETCEQDKYCRFASSYEYSCWGTTEAECREIKPGECYEIASIDQMKEGTYTCDTRFPKDTSDLVCECDSAPPRDYGEEDPDPDACYRMPDGSDYRDAVHTTVTGRQCQKWIEQEPHQHPYTPGPPPHPDWENKGLGPYWDFRNQAFTDEYFQGTCPGAVSKCQCVAPCGSSRKCDE